MERKYRLKGHTLLWITKVRSFSQFSHSFIQT